MTNEEAQQLKVGDRLTKVGLGLTANGEVVYKDSDILVVKFPTKTISYSFTDKCFCGNLTKIVPWKPFYEHTPLGYNLVGVSQSTQQNEKPKFLFGSVWYLVDDSQLKNLMDLLLRYFANPKKPTE